MKIESIKQLKQLSLNNPIECYIQLNFNLRSSKTVEFIDNKFIIYHFIDDTEEELTEDELDPILIQYNNGSSEAQVFLHEILVEN